MQSRLLFIYAALAILPAAVGAQTHAPKPSLSAIGYPLEIQAAAELAAIANDTLTLSATKGSDLYANPDGSKVTDNTPRVLFTPAGDFIFSTRIEAGFNKAFDGAALLVYAGKTNWGKVLFERMPDGSNAVTTTITKGAGDDALHQQVDGGVAYLKLARKGGVYVFYLSKDGTAWRVLRTFALPSGEPVKIGFSAQSPQGERFSARYSDIRWRAKGFDNYWQGE